MPAGNGRRRRAVSTWLLLGGVLVLLVLLVGGLALWRGARDRSRGVDPRDPGADLVATATNTKHPGAPAPGVPHLLGREGNGTVQGRVVGPDGEPIAGATVSAFCFGDRSGVHRRPTTPHEVQRATTGADGAFRMTELPPCPYLLSVTAPGFASATHEDVWLGKDETLRTLELKLSRGGLRLSGRVMDVGGGPIGGATTRLQGRARGNDQPRRLVFAVATGADGRYQLQIPGAFYTVTVVADGYGPAQEMVELVTDDIRDFRLEPAAGIAGRVVSASDRSPVEGAQVWMHAERTPILTRPQVTDVQGRFAFGDLAPGSYRVTAGKNDQRGALPQPINVTAAATITGLEIALQTWLTVEGTVRAGGRPVAGAMVGLMPRNSSMGGEVVQRPSTDPDGRFTLTGLLPGEYVLLVRAQGHPPFSEQLVLRQSMTRDVALPDVARVTGQVLTARDQPAAGATVQASTRSPIPERQPSFDQSTTDENGRFTLGRLAPGELDLHASRDDEFARIERHPIKAGDNPELVVRLVPAGRVSGVVSWDDGKRAEGIRVVTSAGDKEAVTARDGNFTIGPLPTAVEILVVALAPGDRSRFSRLARAEQAEVRLQPGEHRRGIKLVVARRANTIRGVVLDDRGQPLVGAAVNAVREQGGHNVKRGAPPFRASSGPDGSFTLEDLPAGTFVVWAAHPEHADATRSGVPSGASGVELRLGRGGTLAGTVVDSAGKPLGAYTILVVPPSRRRETPATRVMTATGEAAPIPVADPNGAFQITGLAPGSYGLQVWSGDGLYGNLDEVTLAAGERKSNLRIVASRGVTLTGRVQEIGTGRPLPADVFANHPTAAVRTRAGPDGAFALENVAPAAERYLEVHAPGDTHIHERWPVPVPTGKRSQDVGVIWLLRAEDRRLEPRGGGTGLYVGRTVAELTIFDVAPGSPGENHGIRPGTRLLSIDGRDFRSYGSRAAAYLLMGDPGTQVTVAVEPPGQSFRTVTLVRGPRPAP